MGDGMKDLSKSRLRGTDEACQDRGRRASVRVREDRYDHERCSKQPQPFCHASVEIEEPEASDHQSDKGREDRIGCRPPEPLEDDQRLKEEEHHEHHKQHGNPRHVPASEALARPCQPSDQEGDAGKEQELDVQDSTQESDDRIESTLEEINNFVHFSPLLDV